MVTVTTARTVRLIGTLLTSLLSGILNPMRNQSSATTANNLENCVISAFLLLGMLAHIRSGLLRSKYVRVD